MTLTQGADFDDEWLQLRQVTLDAKLKITQNEIEFGKLQLLDIHKEFGYLAIIKDKSVVIDQVSSVLNSIQSTEKSSMVDHNFSISFEPKSTPTCVFFSGDFLFVGMEKAIHVYDFTQLMSGYKTPKFKMNLSQTPIKIRHSRSISVALTKENEIWMWQNFKEEKSIAKDVSAIDAHPQSTHLVYGKTDGTVCLVSMQKTEIFSISVPESTREELESVKVMSVNCLDDDTLLVIYGQPDTDMPVTQYNIIEAADLKNVKSESDLTWTILEDPCFNTSENTYIYIGQIGEYGDEISNVVVCASSASTDVGVIAKKKDEDSGDFIWGNWTLGDGFNVVMPLTDSDDDTFPVGMVVDLSNTINLPNSTPDDPDFPACPIIFILNNVGQLMAYHVLNTHATSKAKDMREPKPLPARTPASIPTSQTASKPLSFGTATLSEPDTATTTSFGVAPFSNGFGSKTATPATKSEAAAPPPASSLFKPDTTPSTNLAFGFGSTTKSTSETTPSTSSFGFGNTFNTSTPTKDENEMQTLFQTKKDESKQPQTTTSLFGASPKTTFTESTTSLFSAPMTAAARKSDVTTERHPAFNPKTVAKKLEEVKLPVEKEEERPILPEEKSFEEMTDNEAFMRRFDNIYAEFFDDLKMCKDQLNGLLDSIEKEKLTSAEFKTLSEVSKLPELIQKAKTHVSDVNEAYVEFKDRHSALLSTIMKLQLQKEEIGRRLDKLPQKDGKEKPMSIEAKIAMDRLLNRRKDLFRAVQNVASYIQQLKQEKEQAALKATQTPTLEKISNAIRNITARTLQTSQELENLESKMKHLNVGQEKKSGRTPSKTSQGGRNTYGLVDEDDDDGKENEQTEKSKMWSRLDNIIGQPIVSDKAELKHIAEKLMQLKHVKVTSMPRPVIRSPSAKKSFSVSSQSKKNEDLTSQTNVASTTAKQEFNLNGHAFRAPQATIPAMPSTALSFATTTITAVGGFGATAKTKPDIVEETKPAVTISSAATPFSFSPAQFSTSTPAFGMMEPKQIQPVVKTSTTSGFGFASSPHVPACTPGKTTTSSTQGFKLGAEMPVTTTKESESKPSLFGGFGSVPASLPDTPLFGKTKLSQVIPSLFGAITDQPKKADDEVDVIAKLNQEKKNEEEEQDLESSALKLDFQSKKAEVQADEKLIKEEKTQTNTFGFGTVSFASTFEKLGSVKEKNEPYVEGGSSKLEKKEDIPKPIFGSALATTEVKKVEEASNVEEKKEESQSALSFGFGSASKQDVPKPLETKKEEPLEEKNIIKEANPFSHTTVAKKLADEEDLPVDIGMSSVEASDQDLTEEKEDEDKSVGPSTIGTTATAPSFGSTAFGSLSLGATPQASEEKKIIFGAPASSAATTNPPISTSGFGGFGSAATPKKPVITSATSASFGFGSTPGFGSGMSFAAVATSSTPASEPKSAFGGGFGGFSTPAPAFGQSGFASMGVTPQANNQSTPTFGVSSFGSVGFGAASPLGQGSMAATFGAPSSFGSAVKPGGGFASFASGQSGFASLANTGASTSSGFAAFANSNNNTSGFGSFTSASSATPNNNVIGSSSQNPAKSPNTPSFTQYRG